MEEMFMKSGENKSKHLTEKQMIHFVDCVQCKKKVFIKTLKKLVEEME